MSNTFSFHVDKEFLTNPENNLEINAFVFVDGGLGFNVYYNGILLVLDMDNMNQINNNETVVLFRDSENHTLYL